MQFACSVEAQGRWRQTELGLGEVLAPATSLPLLRAQERSWICLLQMRRGLLWRSWQCPSLPWEYVLTKVLQLGCWRFVYLIETYHVAVLTALLQNVHSLN